MGLKGMAFSFIAIVAGAIMYWAVRTQSSGFRLSTVGVILMAAGAVGLITSAIVYGTSRSSGSGRRSSFDREVTDAQGLTSTVHEENH
jgi:hypothetical protein